MPIRAPIKVFLSSNDHIDLGASLPTFERVHEQGKAMQDIVPMEAHGEWKPDGDREDVWLAEALKAAMM